MVCVRESPTTNREMDIYLLTERIDDLDVMKKFKAMSQLAAGKGGSDYALKNNTVLSHSDYVMTQKSPVALEDIASAINGFARVVTYANHSIPEYTDVDNPLSGRKVMSHKREHLELIEVVEGEFMGGKLNGYGRKINA